ncbi:hypothetical protein M433DRAFT_145856 [Acidomyces richmondensis BFW]|nr:MAG: hypothetical protein FE78DRAFT_82693 [Acidomyces sp. 'richmondensis']KYG43434.1 hypothetical protein M433DRAFT_145856 [Acidomyces richmondensis BFW]
MPRHVDKEWKILPANQKEYRWSESNKAWVYRDKTRVPKELLPTAGSTRQTPGVVAGTSATVSQQNRSNSVVPQAVQPPSNTKSAAASSSGTQKVTALDQASKVSTLWEIGPLERLSDTRTSTSRQFAAKRIRGRDDGDDGGRRQSGGGRDDGTYGKYTRSAQPKEDYVFGRVIEMLLVPPPIEFLSNASNLSQLSPSPGVPDGAISGMRRFVIIRSSGGNPKSGFSALPIKTYLGLGVSSQGVIKSHHCIIYSRGEPTMKAEERPGRLPDGSPETGMQAQPIKVNPIDRTRPLDPMARLDFFDIHEFDDDVPFTTIYGNVDGDSCGPLLYQYEAVWASIRRAGGGLAERSFGQQVGQSEARRAVAGHEPVELPLRTAIPGRPSQSSLARPTQTQTRMAERTASQANNARANIDREIPLQSRQISMATLDAQLREIQDYANQHQLPQPPELNDTQRQRMTINPGVRQTYFDGVYETWRLFRLRLANQQQFRRTQQAQDDGGDSRNQPSSDSRNEP